MTTESKVGDRVRFIANSDIIPYGVEGTVVVNKACTMDYTIEWDNKLLDGPARFVAGFELELVDNIAITEATTRGHLATSGGLRGHSIGDLYPYTVVGIGYEGWQAFNNETGESIGPVGSYEQAEAYAASAKLASTIENG